MKQPEPMNQELCPGRPKVGAASRSPLRLPDLSHRRHILAIGVLASEADQRLMTPWLKGSGQFRPTLSLQKGGIMGILELVLLALLQLFPQGTDHQMLKERAVPPVSDPTAPPSMVQGGDFGSEIDPNG
jgi:hypothetical protein